MQLSQEIKLETIGQGNERPVFSCLTHRSRRAALRFTSPALRSCSALTPACVPCLAASCVCSVCVSDRSFELSSYRVTVTSPGLRLLIPLHPLQPSFPRSLPVLAVYLRERERERRESMPSPSTHPQYTQSLFPRKMPQI